MDLSESGLNDSQIKAVQHKGSVFLTACPGSGKTKTLTYKIATELSGLKGHRKFVIAITYTHRAADEILERVELLGIPTEQLWIGTIHSFCMEWILRPYAIYERRLESGFTVINQPDSEKIFEELCRKYVEPKIKPLDCNYHFANGKVAPLCSDPEKHDNVKAVLKEYFALLGKERKIDFELMLFFANRLIERFPCIAINLSNIFQIVLLDEYQDTKGIQYSILCSIFSAVPDRTRAFIVGDPNQAIFSSLGGYAIDFHEFKARSRLTIDQLSLTQNYRSSRKIIDYFSRFQIFPNVMTADGDFKDYDSLISHDRETSVQLLEDEIVRLIKYSIDVQGIAQNEICVIGPQWPALAHMTRRLMSKLPDYNFDGPGMVPFGRELDNFWYKLSRICLSEPAPDMYLRRMRWAGEVIQGLREVGVSCAFSNKLLLKMSNQVCIDEKNGMKYLEGYFSWFMSLFGIDSLVDYPDLDNHYKSFFDTARRRIEKAKSDGLLLIEDVENFKRAFRPRSGITVSTIHGVKGAEFDNVISFALLEDMVPHWADPQKLISAKKLIYVICSRARKNVFLISEVGRKKLPTKVLAAIAYKGYQLP